MLDQLAPRSRRNAPRLEREMLDDFNRRVSFGATPLLCCCCGLARGLLLFTLSPLPAHLVGLSEGKRNDRRQRGGKHKMYLPQNVAVQIMRVARVYETPAPMKLILLVQNRCKTKHGFGALGLAM